jgi:6-phosphogluconolactonase
LFFIIVLRFHFSQELRMVKKAVVLMFACASVASWVSCKSTSSHYVYASLPGPSQIAAFREDPNSGVLTAIPGSPFPSGASPESIAIHPSGKFLYAVNGGENENNVSLFDVAGSGVLSEIPPRTPVGEAPKLLAMDAGGNFLYVANGGANTVSVFSIDQTNGTLTAVQNPFPVGMSPSDMKLNSAGTVLYMVGAESNVLASFGITNGALTSLIQSSSNSPGNSPGNGPNAIAIAPDGNYLYIANTLDGSISIFGISSSGVFTQTAGSPFAESLTADPLSLAVHPSGNFLFVANSHSNNVAVYSITTSSGALTATATPTYGTQSGPSFLAVDPNGNFLLVGAQGAAGIQAFGIDGSNGSLNAIASYPVGNTPSSIAVIP